MTLRLLTRATPAPPTHPSMDVAAAPAGTSRRVLELAPGIWIVKYTSWQHTSAVLDTNAELPIVVEIVEIPKREFPWPEWHQDASCAGMGDELFFGDDPDLRPTLKLSELREARAICAQCPVARKCLQWALTKPEKFGVWAGTSGRQRDRMWAQMDSGWSLDGVMDAWLNR